MCCNLSYYGCFSLRLNSIIRVFLHVGKIGWQWIIWAELGAKTFFQLQVANKTSLMAKALLWKIINFFIAKIIWIFYEKVCSCLLFILTIQKLLNGQSSLLCLKIKLVQSLVFLLCLLHAKIYFGLMLIIT